MGLAVRLDRSRLLPVRQEAGAAGAAVVRTGADDLSVFRAERVRAGADRCRAVGRAVFHPRLKAAAGGLIAGGLSTRHAERGQRASVRSQTCRYNRSEEHTSELKSLMRISYAVFCLKKKKQL